jgi:uncharacterized protein
MDKIALEILAISYSKAQTGAYALILGEVDGKRRLPIIIGAFEAQSIAIAIEKMKPTRPLTHDLFKNFADNFGVFLQEVIIHKFYEGVFYAKLLYINEDTVKEIDARTSDAVALAVRYNCPIYTYEEIFNEAGIMMEEGEEEDVKSDEPKSTKKGKGERKKIETGSEFSALTVNELKEKLKQAVNDEAYEFASLIRDEIKRRGEKE